MLLTINYIFSSNILIRLSVMPRTGRKEEGTAQALDSFVKIESVCLSCLFVCTDGCVYGVSLVYLLFLLRFSDPDYNTIFK